MRIEEHLLLQILQDNRFLLHVDLVMLRVGYDGILRLAVRLQAKSEPQNVRGRTCSTQADYLAKVCLLVRTQDRNIWTESERIEALLCLPNKKIQRKKQILAKNQFPGLTTSHQVQEFLCIFKRKFLDCFAELWTWCVWDGTSWAIRQVSLWREGFKEHFLVLLCARGTQNESKMDPSKTLIC